jgi:hypothetical protein
MASQPRGLTLSVPYFFKNKTNTLCPKYQLLKLLNNVVYPDVIATNSLKIKVDPTQTFASRPFPQVKILHINIINQVQKFVSKSSLLTLTEKVVGG